MLSTDLEIARASFDVEKGLVSVPLIANVPHSSTYIPPSIRKSLLLNDHELEVELLKMTDWFVDDLFSEMSEVGGISVIYNYSRLVVDPERFEDDEKEKMSSKGMGVIYEQTSDGNKLRAHVPSDEERQELLDRFYRPYHQAIEDETQALLDTFDRCLILDCHSFPSRPLPYERVQDPNRPDICLGVDSYHTPRELIGLAEDFLAKYNLSTDVNMPFEGTYVPLKFLRKDKRVSSLMVEINRKLYMDETTGLRFEAFHETKRIIAELVKHISKNLFQF